MTLSKEEREKKLKEIREKTAQQSRDIDTLHQQASTNVNNVIAATQAATNDLAQVISKLEKDQVSTIGEPSSSCCSIH
ncbi:MULTISPECIES: hypothetical protein [unclassified Rickettsia]|uniref:hypothetical protein n=1 Tax=unclassified Rickettsia TaxID=114295 RepID=UPI003132FEBC